MVIARYFFKILSRPDHNDSLWLLIVCDAEGNLSISLNKIGLMRTVSHWLCVCVLLLVVPSFQPCHSFAELGGQGGQGGQGGIFK